jgi:hypothetical protein
VRVHQLPCQDQSICEIWDPRMLLLWLAHLPARTTLSSPVVRGCTMQRDTLRWVRCSICLMAGSTMSALQQEMSAENHNGFAPVAHLIIVTNILLSRVLHCCQ